MFFQNRMNKKMAEFQSSLIEKYYIEVENMYRQVRGWRHDYSNHIQTLKAYMMFSEYDKINEYLDMLNEDLTNVDMILKTGNIMIDAILNSKISLAVLRQIDVNAKAIVPENLTISDIDLCIIIGNLLDNAIEACDSITDDRKFIRIFIGVKNTQLYMIFTNSAPGKKMLKYGNIFNSRKGENHGFGLTRIDKTVEKYGGFIDRGSEDGAFTTEILLPM